MIEACGKEPIPADTDGDAGLIQGHHIDVAEAAFQAARDRATLRLHPSLRSRLPAGIAIDELLDQAANRDSPPTIAQWRALLIAVRATLPGDTYNEKRRQTDVPDWIPARMLNEFAYCPRLAYLEWVQGEFADNLDTIEGRFGHRRVDRASTESLPEPNDDQSDHSTDMETIHSRSLTLSAPGEGLIAKMDLVDIDSGTAVPVDYKRGRVPNVPGAAWEPEQVQLCAQGLILRENGYHCEGGILYFIESRRRVSIQFDEALVNRTRELAKQMRGMASLPTIPPPLIDSPKCPRCRHLFARRNVPVPSW